MPRQRLALHLNYTVVAVALVVTALDALSKAWARHYLMRHDVHVVGALSLRLRYNTGIAFSINRSGPIVTTIATVLVALTVLLVGLNATRGWPALGFGLMIGGGLANVLDRLTTSAHRVTDFIAVSSFPVFNLADAAITVGFIVLVVVALRGDRLLGR